MLLANLSTTMACKKLETEEAQEFSMDHGRSEASPIQAKQEGGLGGP